MNKLIFVALLVVLVLVFGCTQEVQKPQPSSAVPAPGREDVKEMIIVEDPQPEEEQPEEIAETEVEQPEEEPKATIKEFTMTAKQWEFIPGTITVNQGDTVKITVTSTDVTHGFRLLEFGINEQLQPGNSVDIEFIADKKGTFTFSCSVPCGSGHGGMRGTLIVK